MATDHPHDHLNTANGQTTAEACTRSAKEGTNEAAKGTHRSVWRRLATLGDMLRQPIFALLVTAALPYMMLGDLAEGLMLPALVLAVLVLRF